MHARVDNFASDLADANDAKRFTTQPSALLEFLLVPFVRAQRGDLSAMRRVDAKRNAKTSSANGDEFLPGQFVT